MTTTPKTSEPTPAQKRAFCRKAVAIWLREFADKIDSGEVDAFQLAWSHDAEEIRPRGSLMSDAAFVKATLPHEQTRPAPRLSEIRAPIPVEDLSENIRDLKPCEDSDCPNCGKKT